MILAIRTDKPVAELVLLDEAGNTQVNYSWEAHRALATTLVGKIDEFLEDNSVGTQALTGIIVFSGSGSFTGLRIGATVANALAYSHGISVVAGEGENWLIGGAVKLKLVKPGNYVVPAYDREPNITKPKQ
jgi:tRNA A37 threonylcarbamoyladenosine modification protein TsaB